MRTKHHFDVAGLLSFPCRRHAVVVGGSMAGMMAARVLSDHFEGVTLLERDRFPETPAARKGLPQGRHAHGLLERGRGILEQFLPGLTEELVRAGAQLMDATRDFACLNPYGWWLRGESSRLGQSRGRVFQHKLARATAAAWQLSTGADYRFPTTEGPPEGRVARLAGRYIAGVMRAATRRPSIRRRLGEVLNLLRPPSALFGPGILARLTWDRLAGQADAGDGG